jgi:hypothetical protein
MHRPIEQSGAFAPPSANVIVHRGLVTWTTNLLPDQGLPEFKHKIAYQCLGNNKVVVMSLRRMRQPRKNIPIFFLKQKTTIGPPTNSVCPARDDR